MSVLGGIEVYRCGTCRAFLPVEAFYRTKSSLFGLKTQCKECHGRSNVASRNPENQKRLRVEAEARRRARQAGARGRVSAEDMRALRALWGARCLACGAGAHLQWDHVVPLARGGAHCVSNLQCLCRRCNEKKQARTADYRSDEQRVWALTFRRVG